jgi:hypothetical protein
MFAGTYSPPERFSQSALPDIIVASALLGMATQTLLDPIADKLLISAALISLVQRALFILPIRVASLTDF